MKKTLISSVLALGFLANTGTGFAEEKERGEGEEDPKNSLYSTAPL